MQILITHGTLARTRVLSFNRWQLLAAISALAIFLMLLSGTIYHVVFLKAAREGWPVVSQIVRFVVRDEFAQRDRFMRENLDAMAQRVGEMQAKLIKLEAMGERVSNMTGLKPDDAKPASPKAAAPGPVERPAQGGPFVPLGTVSLEQLAALVDSLDQQTDESTDVFTLVESRLFEKRLSALMIPSSRPLDGPVGSGFGFRSDPFTNRSALHTGLDFPAPTGAPIMAAAGGVVRSTDYHPQYGNLLEIDHRNGLVTRYAHASLIRVKLGDVVKRGQHVADVGSTGRSTGPHLHFEVMVEGVHQDPAKFLAGAAGAPLASVARTSGRVGAHPH